MQTIDSLFLSRLAPVYHGTRGTRQQAHIRAVGIFLPAATARHAISTPLRKAHFAAQVCEESWGFSDLEEEGSGREYEGRIDLGNTQPGDGPRFKGRGLLQITGRANYRRTGSELNLDLVDRPDLAASPAVAVETACTFWSDHGLNFLADRDDLRGITRVINGSQMRGLVARAGYLATAKRLLGIA